MLCLYAFIRCIYRVMNVCTYACVPHHHNSSHCIVVGLSIFCPQRRRCCELPHYVGGPSAHLWRVSTPVHLVLSLSPVHVVLSLSHVHVVLLLTSMHVVLSLSPVHVVLLLTSVHVVLSLSPVHVACMAVFSCHTRCLLPVHSRIQCCCDVTLLSRTLIIVNALLYLL